MRASLSQFTALLLAGFLFGCASSEPRHPAASEPPAIVIYQTPDYPMPSYDSEFHGGLVVALWRDGRMVRATRLNAVGKFYVEGFVKPALREEFFVSLGTCKALQLLECGGIPVDAASETITVRRDGKTSRWTRVLPDKQSAWCEFESGLMSLPLSDSQSLGLMEVERINLYK
ncbi:MAG: hypothetical protein ABSD57_04435 [Verrucomicrobiota bacterium]|jgi:hypothetical protein